MTDFESSPLHDMDKSLRFSRPVIGDIPTAFGSMALGVAILGAEVAYKAYKKVPEVQGFVTTRLAIVANAISNARQERFAGFYGADAQEITVPPYLLPDNSEFVAMLVVQQSAQCKRYPKYDSF